MNRKMTVRFKVLLICMMVVHAVGCSTRRIPKYVHKSASTGFEENLATTERISVAPFTAEKPGRNSFKVRLTGSVKTPKGEPFEVYIRQALIKRLKAADLYSEDSSRILEGHLQEIEMSTSPGSWTIHVKFNRGSRESFDVLYVYKFMAGYYASQAQVNAAEEFPNAVREFIEEVIENPGFRKFIGN